MNQARRLSRLVLATLRTHGPLSDAQLGWWLSHFGVEREAARRARGRLTKAGAVRFSGRLARGETGRFGMQWEIKHKEG